MGEIKYFCLLLIASIIYHGLWIYGMQLFGLRGSLSAPIHVALLFLVPSLGAILGALAFVNVDGALAHKIVRWSILLLGAAIVPVVGLQCVGAMACVLLDGCL